MPEKIPAEEGRYVLCLYVAGTTPQSGRAIKNLKAICEAYLPGRYQPDRGRPLSAGRRAREAQIMVAPTLVREFPVPVRRLIGDLSHTGRVLGMLELPT